MFKSAGCTAVCERGSPEAFSGLSLGPTRMAECCSLSYRQLAWATEWYLGDEQLEAANDVLVDYLHQLQLAAHWGTGAFSS